MRAGRGCKKGAISQHENIVIVPHILCIKSVGDERKRYEDSKLNKTTGKIDKKNTHMHILLVIVVASVVFVINIITVGLLASLCEKKMSNPKRDR